MTSETSSTSSVDFHHRIAPRDDTRLDHFLEEILRDAYDPGTVLRYHDYDLSHLGAGVSLWRVSHVDGDRVTAFVPGAFRDTRALRAYLEEVCR